MGQSNEDAFIPWDKQGLYPLKDLSGTYAFLASQVIDEGKTVVFLSELTNEIIFYDLTRPSNIPAYKINVPSSVEDFYLSKGLLYVLANNTITIIDQFTGSFKEVITFDIPKNEEFWMIHRIIVLDSRIYLLTIDEKTFEVSPEGLKLQNKECWLATNGDYVRTEVINDRSFTLLVNSKTYTLNQDIQISSLGLGTKLLTATSIGNINDRIYLDIETSDDVAETDVKRWIVELDSHGKLISSFNIPFLYFTSSKRQFDISESGLFYSLSAPEGVFICEWENGKLHIPAVSVERYHYNEHLLNIPEPPAEIDESHNRAGNNCVTRSQVYANAQNFLQMTWVAGPTNWVPTCTTLQDGTTYKTPAWVSSNGPKTSIPYKWGGFTKWETWKAFVADNKKCGNAFTCIQYNNNYQCINTNGLCSGTPNQDVSDSKIIGVDCSGFVGRTWEVTQKPGTGDLGSSSMTIDLGLASSYSGFNNLKLGDIVNKSGSHTRLFIKHLPNEYALFIESANLSGSEQSRVRSANYARTATDLSGYSSRRFNNIIDARIQLSQEISLSSNPVSNGCPITVSYKLKNSGSESWTGNIQLVLLKSDQTQTVLQTNTSITINPNSSTTVFTYTNQNVSWPTGSTKAFIQIKNSSSSCNYGAYYLAEQDVFLNPITFIVSNNGCSSCNTPGNLSTTNITSTTATFNWSAVSGALNYSVQKRPAGGAWADVPNSPTSATSLTITGLTACTNYEWRVRTNCTNGQSSVWSNPVSFTTTCPCATPGGLSTTNITATTATFNWSAVSGASNYSIEWRFPGGSWSPLNGGPFSGTSVNVTGLIACTAYEWRIKTNCTNGQSSAWSNPVSFTTTCPCATPGGLSTTNITATTATFNWSAVSGASNYSIEWRFPGGSWNPLNGGPFSGTSVNVTGFIACTAYEWRIKTNCTNGQSSAWSTAVGFTTIGCTCSIPTGLTTTNIGQTSATANWSAVSGALNYNLQYRIAGSSWLEFPNNPINGTSATITGLTPGTNYEWRVKTNCTGGLSSNWSTVIAFTTLPVSGCNTPSGLITTNITATTATFNWSAVSGASNYSIEWRFPGGSWNPLNGGPFSGTSVNVSGLIACTAYEWRIKTNCTNGQSSAWSNPVSFTTLCTCNTPSGLSTTNITTTTATFNWSAVSGALNYLIEWRYPNGSWNPLNGGPFTGTYINVTGFTACTAYEWRIKTNCTNGQSSNWSAPVAFSTLCTLTNDNCANAISLSVNSTCVNTSATNVGATASTPAPQGGCPTSGYKDVWFKFNMPNVSDPQVTIRTTAGSLTDAVMEVYYGSSCTSMTYIVCEDDNTQGNNSNMPVINLQGGPNNTIWVRVWGYNGTVGTFSICVLNYYSVNLAEYHQPDEPVMERNDMERTIVVKSFERSLLQETAPAFSVTPNPADDILHVSINQNATDIPLKIILRDLTGKEIAQQTIEASDDSHMEFQFNVVDIVPGIYLLGVITEKGILSERIIIAHD